MTRDLTQSPPNEPRRRVRSPASPLLRAGRPPRRLVLAFLIGVVSLGCGATGRLARIDGDGIDPPSREPSRYFPHDRDAFDESELVGEATWYGGRFQGRSTANGERFDMHLMTAAHRELPFNTVVRVVRDDDRRSVVVRVNDRGPGSPHRVIDLSWAAAHEIGMVEQGHADVQLEILHWGNGAVYE